MATQRDQPWAVQERSPCLTDQLRRLKALREALGRLSQECAQTTAATRRIVQQLRAICESPIPDPWRETSRDIIGSARLRREPHGERRDQEPVRLSCGADREAPEPPETVTEPDLSLDVQLRPPERKLISFSPQQRGEFIEGIKPDSPVSMDGCSENPRRNKAVELPLLRQRARSGESNPIGWKEKSRQPSQLTSRQRQIVTLVALGYTNKQIAEQLFLSEQTVKNHLFKLFRKLGVTDRLGLALYAVHHGLYLNAAVPVRQQR